MGQSKKVRAGTRTYYFDECTDKKGNRFISIAEVPHTPNRHRHRIFVHEEDFEKFAEGYNTIIKAIQNGNKS